MSQCLGPFDYLEPDTLEEAIEILKKNEGEAKVLAGGVDLLYRLRCRQLKPKFVVSIRKPLELHGIKSESNGNLSIGALVTVRDLESNEEIYHRYHLLWEAASQIASYQIKNMATVVGNLCVASPASDLAPPLVALGATVRVAGSSSERIIPLEDFFVSPGKTVLKQEEIVTHLIIPKATRNSGGAFLKLGRSATDVSKVNVAVLLKQDSPGAMQARIVVGAVAPTVFRALEAEELLKRHKYLDDELLHQVARVAAQTSTPIDDVRSTMAYRRQMIEVLLRCVVTLSFKRLEQAASGG